MQEMFLPVRGYEGLYEISNHGNLRNSKGNIIVPGSNGKGYTMYALSKDDRKKNLSGHRLVASTFIANIDNKPHVNHIDGNKRNNHISNLEWCTASENMRHAIDILGYRPKISKRHDRRIRVCQYSILGEFIKIWDSMKDAEIALDIAHICQAVRGKRKTAGGFIWKLSQ